MLHPLAQLPAWQNSGAAPQLAASLAEAQAVPPAHAWQELDGLASPIA